MGFISAILGLKTPIIQGKYLEYHKIDNWKICQDGWFENRAYLNKSKNLYVVEGTKGTRDLIFDGLT